MTVATITTALRARDHGMAIAETALAAEQDRLVIDNAIAHFAALGDEFSANDVRRVLPAVSGALIGSRFLAASKRGQIERTGSTLADHEQGHARRVSTWVKATGRNAVTDGVTNSVRQDASGLTAEQDDALRRAQWALAGGTGRAGIPTIAAARALLRDIVNAFTGGDASDGLFLQRRHRAARDPHL